MKVEIRLFAYLRERAGCATVELELAQGATVEDALKELADKTALGQALEEGSVVAAVNREYCSRDKPLEDGDELALIPPVSGGSGINCHVRISGTALSLAGLVEMVKHPGAGAIVTFEGTTRELPLLYYEAYEEMARDKLQRIAEDAASRHDLEAVAVEHRVGEVPLSEPSVAIAVSSAHREQAFAAAREIIDRIKAEAPIWKKEIGDGGERWAKGKPPTVT